MSETGICATVYVLRSMKDGNLYIGCTKDLEQRLKEHARGYVRSTKHRRPLTLIYMETFSDKTEAYKRESFFKTAKGKRVLLTAIKLSSPGIV